MKILMLLLLLTSSPSAYSFFDGHEGNGGDLVEAHFITIGFGVLDVLYETPRGHCVLSHYNIPIEALEATLDYRRIESVQGGLLDNLAREVDAIVVENIIFLSRDRWIEFINSKMDLRLLVFHEMLRSAGFDDDNYEISHQLFFWEASSGSTKLARNKRGIINLQPPYEPVRIEGIFKANLKKDNLIPESRRPKACSGFKT